MSDLLVEVTRILAEGEAKYEERLTAESEEPRQTLAAQNERVPRENAAFATGREKAAAFMKDLRKQIEAKEAATNPAPSTEPTDLEPEVQDRHKPARDEKLIPPTREENERYWREYWHPRPVLLHESEYGKVYELNKNWVFPYAHVHHDFVDLLQLFYDLLPLVKANRMSTSEVQVITSQTLLTSKGITSLDRNILERYRGRHYVSFSKSYSPADKLNDARKLLAKVSEGHGLLP